MAAMRISPDLGVHRLRITPMSSDASARASSVCGTCRFISSPSKSALYGLHTHSLKRNVLHNNHHVHIRDSTYDKHPDGFRFFVGPAQYHLHVQS